MARKLIVELLDVVQFATPNIAHIDVERTAHKIVQYKKRGTVRNYNTSFEPIKLSCQKVISTDQVRALMDLHPDVDWRPYLKTVATMLHEFFFEFGGTWYPANRKPISVFRDVWTKPAIRGVVVKDRQAFPTLVNPRSSLFLGSPLALSFLGRGVHELHVVDDPQAVAPLIIDTGKHPATEVRDCRVNILQEADLMPLEEFERILKQFLEAVRLAGFDADPDRFYTVDDLFRKPRSSPP